MKKQNIKTLVVSAALLSITACNTGNVQVDNGSTAPPTAASNSQQGSVSSPNPTLGGSSGSSEKSADANVYFERVMVGLSLPQTVIAISFTADNVSDIAPFGVSLNGFQNFNPNSVFIPGSNEITYLRTIDVGTDAILSTSPSTMQTQQVFAFPRQVVDFSIDRNSNTVAWVDTAGVISVSLMDGSQSETLDTSSFTTNVIADKVAWNSTGTRLLVLSNNNSALVFTTGNTKPTALNHVSTAAFSPDGSQLAYFSSNNKSIHIVDITSGTDTQAGVLESSEIHDFSWSQGGGISYWTRLSSGQEEIRVFTAATQETTVAELSVPASIGDGVVCPAWMGSTLYFGNFYAGNYLIERTATGAKKQIEAKPFTQVPPGDLNEGFICPKVE
jgi:hypothetical protein